MTAASQDLRPIHYMGNKARYLTAIEAAVNEVAKPRSSACDLFAGSAVVSRRLAQRRPVVSCDVQAYSTVLVNALSRPRAFSDGEVAQLLQLADDWLRVQEPAMSRLLVLEANALALSAEDPAPLADIVEFGSLALVGLGGPDLLAAKEAADGLDLKEATLTRYYGGVYFSYRQALELDALRHACRVTWGDDRDATAVAALLGVASDLASSVGNHFAQPVQPRGAGGLLKRWFATSVATSRRQSVLVEYAAWLSRYAALEKTAFECTALQADYRVTLAGLGEDVGVIYADPPYTRDHYSRFYHVLETIALDDDPGVTLRPGTSDLSRGMYRESRHQSPFSIRSQVRPAFEELFQHAQRLHVPLVLSYSPRSIGTKARPETRLLSISDLLALAEGYFPDVRVVPVASSAHSQFNRRELNAIVEGGAEVLIVARP